MRPRLVCFDCHAEIQPIQGAPPEGTTFVCQDCVEARLKRCFDRPFAPSLAEFKGLDPAAFPDMYVNGLQVYWSKKAPQKPPDLEAIRGRNEKLREVVRFTQERENEQRAQSGRVGFISEYESGPMAQEVADIDTLLAEVDRLKSDLSVEQRSSMAYRKEGDLDRAGMREFQSKFIAADHEKRNVAAEVERLRTLESTIVRLETLHGGKDHPQNCSAFGVCAIGDVMRLIRQPLLIVDPEHDTRSLVKPIPL